MTIQSHRNVAAGSHDLPLQLAVLRFGVCALVTQHAAPAHSKAGSFLSADHVCAQLIMI